MAEEVIIECQKCGREVGRIVEIDGMDWLNVNGIAVNYMKGVCIDCGQEFHWSLSERQLARLIKSVKAR